MQEVWILTKLGGPETYHIIKVANVTDEQNYE